MPLTAALRVASAPRPYTVSVGNATGTSLCCRRVAASCSGSMVACTEGSEETSQVSRLSGDLNCPGSFPVGTCSILVFIVADFMTVVETALGLEDEGNGDGEDDADETGRKDRRVAAQDAVQSRIGR